jgi:hypothetical protein
MSRKTLFLILAALLALSSAASAADGLIGWWQFDEGTGTTCKDSSGLGNDGTFGTEGTPTWVAGIQGGAVYLDGDDDYIEINKIADDMPANNNFTISACIMTTTGDGNVIGANDTGSGHDFIFGLASNGYVLVEADSVRNYPPSLNDGKWHMITYVRDGTTATIYADGVQIGTETPSGNPGGQARWSIGQEWDSSPSDEYQGAVDEVRFYNVPLSAAQVAALWKEIRPAILKATNPDPADGGTGASMPLLGWTAGDTAVFHNVYLGASPTLTEADLVAANQPFAMYYHVAGVEPGMTYYWRVDEIDADGAVITGDVWSFSTLSTKAAEPSPHNKDRFAAADATLTWTPGYGAQTHTVYFGTSLEEVTNASGGTPQATPAYTPASPLDKNTTYYWRVDEFDGTNTYTGPVWSFTTMSDIEITDPDLVGWWTFDEGGATKALDFSGHGNDGTYGGGVTLVDGVVGYAVKLSAGYIAIDGIVDDLKGTNLTLSAWIKSTQTGEGNVFAANDSDSGHPLMFGIDGGGTYVNDGSDTNFARPLVNDDQWHLITYVRNGSAGAVYVDGVQVGVYSATFSLDSVTRWSVGQEWDGSSPSDFYSGLVDDVRVYSKALTPDEVQALMRGDPVLAWKPSPSNGATVDVVKAGDGLTWSAGDNAQEHDVYFGTDQAAVKNADASDQTGVYRGRQAEASFTPAETLGWGTGPYYWRVDEVQEDGTVSVGPVWSLSVADYLIVDDMEGYTDKEGEEIYTTWVDGFTDGLSNSTVGLMTAVGGTFGETTIVHGGIQSMPMTYDNSKTPFFSETVQTFAPLQDWTAYGVDTLILFWRGNAGNGADQLYLIVEDSAGKQAFVANTDSPDVKVTTWTEWKIPLSSLTGLNLAKIEKLYIGVGNPKAPAMGGAGTVYVDDIRLTKPPAAVSGPLDVRIEDGANDAEEHLTDGSMDVTSSDLEFPYEDNADPSATDPQLTALRFVLPLAQGAQISQAYLEFEVDEDKGNDKPVNVIIEAQLVADAPAIADTAGNLSSRTAWTKAKVKWTVPMGLTANTKFQSPDIAAILTELVNQAGWTSGNAVLLVIRDDPDAPSTGLRCVEAVEGEATAAPLLHVE